MIDPGAVLARCVVLGGRKVSHHMKLPFKQVLADKEINGHASSNKSMGRWGGTCVIKCCLNKDSNNSEPLSYNVRTIFPSVN